MPTQYKYHYDVRVDSVKLHAPLPSANDRLCFLWTRGSKTAMTSQKQVSAQGTIEYAQGLSLICTLFRDGDSGSSRYLEKLCSFALVERDERASGMLTVCKCKITMAPYADVPADAPRQLTLSLTRGRSQLVATVKVAISSRWLGEQAAAGASDAWRHSEPTEAMDDSERSESEFEDPKPPPTPSPPSSAAAAGTSTDGITIPKLSAAAVAAAAAAWQPSALGLDSPVTAGGRRRSVDAARSVDRDSRTKSFSVTSVAGKNSTSREAQLACAQRALNSHRSCSRARTLLARRLTLHLAAGRSSPRSQRSWPRRRTCSD